MTVGMFLLSTQMKYIFVEGEGSALRWNERSVDPLPHYTSDLPAVSPEVNTHSAARENTSEDLMH